MSVQKATSSEIAEPWNLDASTWTMEQHNIPEKYWVGLQKWLEEKGYTLRPRFREDWVASWLGTDKDCFECEDGQVHTSLLLMDAIRNSDGAPVMLKAVSKTYTALEVGIARYLCSEPLASDPRNHCVTIHEAFPVPEELQLRLPNETGEDIMVMPRLRDFRNPRFDTIGEAVDFFSQIFEGLQFLHALNVAHRDCNKRNIMMDARPMYPNSWHPAKVNRTPDLKTEAKHFTRTERPVKYYFIDFGLSRRYQPEECPPMEPIILGGDKSPPEHNISGVHQCDPFPTDVYFLGNLVREEFIEPKLGFAFMKSLVNDMTAEDPSKRPTMDEVVTRFGAIRKSLSSWKLRSRVVFRDELSIVAPFRIVPHWVRRIRYIITRRPAIPTPNQ